MTTEPPLTLLPKLNASGQYRTTGRLPGVLWTLDTTSSYLTGQVQWSVTLAYLNGRGRRHYTDFAETLWEANAAGLGVVEAMAAHPPKRGRSRWIPREVIGRSRRRRAVLRSMQQAKPVTWAYVKPRFEVSSEGAPTREQVEAVMVEAGKNAAAALNEIALDRLGLR